MQNTATRELTYEQALKDLEELIDGLAERGQTREAHQIHQLVWVPLSERSRTA